MGNDRLQESLQRLQRQDPLRLGAPDAVWHAERLEERRYSRIFVVRPDTAWREAVEQRLESDAIILKLYHAVQAPRRQREFDDLQRVHSVCAGEARRAVVRPVAVYADIGALLTARAPGVPASALVRRASRIGASAAVVRDATVLCTQAGEWLRDFQGSQQRLAEGSPHLATSGEFDAYVAARLNGMRQGPVGIDERLHRRTLTAMRLLLTQQHDALHETVWSHSDYGPHNLLADSSRLTVLDFELMPQHAWFDAAYFIESLAGFAGPLVLRRRVERLQRAFLDSYGVSGNESLFLLLRLRHLVCTAASVRGRRTRLAALLWPEFSRLRHRLHLLVDQMETAVATSGVSSPQWA